MKTIVSWLGVFAMLGSVAAWGASSSMSTCGSMTSNKSSVTKKTYYPKHRTSVVTSHRKSYSASRTLGAGSSYRSTGKRHIYYKSKTRPYSAARTMGRGPATKCSCASMTGHKPMKHHRVITHKRTYSSYKPAYGRGPSTSVKHHTYKNVVKHSRYSNSKNYKHSSVGASTGRGASSKKMMNNSKASVSKTSGLSSCQPTK